MASVSWQEWDGPAFERATREDRPILLLLTASWCRFCRELLATTFADAEVIHEVEAGFVPVMQAATATAIPAAAPDER